MEAGGAGFIFGGLDENEDGQITEGEVMALIGDMCEYGGYYYGGYYYGDYYSYYGGDYYYDYYGGYYYDDYYYDDYCEPLCWANCGPDDDCAAVEAFCESGEFDDSPESCLANP